MATLTVRLSNEDMKAIADMVVERLKGLFQPPGPAKPRASDDLLSGKEVQEILGISATTFYEWRTNGVLSGGVRIGPKCWRWRRDAIMKLLEAENGEAEPTIKEA